MTEDILAQRPELREEFDRLVEATLHEVMNYARRICYGDPGLAHDLYMDAWMYVLSRFPLMAGMNEVKFAVYFQKTIKAGLAKYRSSRGQYILDAEWQDPILGSLPPPVPKQLWVEAEFGYGQELSPALADALSTLTPWDLRAISLFADGINEIEAAAELEVEVDDYLSAVAEIQEELRSTLESTPDLVQDEDFDQDYITRQELVVQSGLSWYRIQPLLPALARQGLTSVRLINGAGWVSEHFPVDMVPVLKKHRLPRPAGEWLTVKEMSRRAHRPQDWVERRIWRYQHLREERLDNRGRLVWHYPPSVLAILMTESEAQADVPPAGNWLTAGGLARALGRSNTYVTAHIGEFSRLAQDRLDVRGRILPHYPPEVFVALGGDLSQLPETNPSPEIQAVPSCYTATAMSRELGRSEGWVSRHLVRYECLARLQPASNGHEVPHYPAIVLDALRVESNPDSIQPDSSWHTVRSLGHALGRAQRWVINRVIPFDDLSGWITGSNGRPWKVYHPVVHAVLLAQSLYLASLPPVGDWLSVPDLAESVGRSQRWVRNHLAAIGYVGEDRVGVHNLVWPCFHPDSEEALKTLRDAEDAIPFIGDWLTIRGIADAIGRSWSWVAARIEPYRDQCESRLDASGRISEAYPPSVKEELEAISSAEKLLVAPPDVWLTASGMARLLGRDKEWVFARLAEFEFLARELYDTSGKPATHYPVIVLEELRAMSDDEQARREDLLRNWRMPLAS